MMTFSNTLMFSLHHMTFGMLLFWIMILPLYFVMKFIKNLMTHCFRTLFDRIPSTTPGAEPPRDARDSGSARSHSTHLETSSSDRPKMVTYTETQTVSSYMSVKCTRRTLRMPNFTRATHAQPSLSNFPLRDSDFGKRTCSCGMTQLERNFPTSPQNKKTKLTDCSIYVPMRTISTPQIK